MTGLKAQINQPTNLLFLLRFAQLTGVWETIVPRHVYIKYRIVHIYKQSLLLLIFKHVLN